MFSHEDPAPALKRELAAELAKATEGWSVFQIAARTGESFSRASRARNGHVEGISLEALVRMLARMNRHVTVRVAAAAGFPEAGAVSISSKRSSCRNRTRSARRG